MADSRGFAEGERIAMLSTFTLLGIGIAEIIIGWLTESLGLTADGVDSFMDAGISMIVWLGLKYSRRAPDEKFHFGYLKVESFAALMASIGMVTIASLILYYSYLRFLEPRIISYPVAVLATLVGAGSISLLRAFQMRRVARRYNLLSLRIGAYNSIKDGTASFVVFGAVLASVVGFPQMDAVGGMIISGYIYSMAYISIKEASLVLVDACNRPELVDDIRKIAESNHGVTVEGVRLRMEGPYTVGVISLAADGNMTLDEVEGIKNRLDSDLRKEIEGLGRLSITVKPRGSEDDGT